MSHGKCEPTNTNAADYKLYARFDAGETLESVLASPPTTKHNKVTSEGNIVTGSFKPSGLFPPALQK
ncbi:hypothetical protein KAF88_13085 [Klebsiella pneumoniae]|uniref:hypothetical protein n=1 Tax=Klebsiella pneumoniae TaxID=573 RepID=UPI001D616358|nr:hypothetical protein [Klebsiella pneumoniae]MCB7672482.1 hypothetical protein [Klebsiella pneumoniae]